MRFQNPFGAMALAFILAVPAMVPANAFSARDVAVSVDTETPVHTIGHRHGKHRKFAGGITYTGRYGLKYVPDQWRHRDHGTDVSVKVYIGSRERDAYRQRAQPLIIDLPN